MTATPNRLSVALATYNGEAYLEEQLESIAAQTRLPDELVVRDDGSTDGTVAILHAFARRAPFPVRVIEGDENLGYARNFGEVLAACTGDLVALSDQDDVWLPEKLARLEAALGDEPEVLLAFCDLELVDAGLRPLGKTMWEHLRFGAAERARFEGGWRTTPLLERYCVTGAAACFRATLLPVALPITTRGYHDAWLALLAALCGRVVPVAEPLVLYRQHGRNQLGAAPREGFWEGVRRRAFRWHVGDRVIAQHTASRRDVVAGAIERLDALGLMTPEQRAVLRPYARHVAFRADLPPYPGRAVGLLREVASGRYGLLSGGISTAARDALRIPLLSRRSGDGEGPPTSSAPRGPVSPPAPPAPPATPLLDSSGICAVVVTYHPDGGLTDRIRTVLAHAARVLVVDNTPGEEPEPVRELRRMAGVGVHRMGYNAGIAAALNAGVAAALRDGYPWVLLLDQDTSLRTNYREAVRAALQTMEERVGLVGVNFENSATGRFYGDPSGPVREVPYVVSSGSLLRAEAARAAGGFRDDFFIDYVDIEYGLRLRRSGFSVVLSPEVAMDHGMGEATERRVLGRPRFTSNYPPLRHYYMARNFVVTARLHGRAERGWLRGEVRRRLRFTAFTLLAEPGRARKLSGMVRGYADGLRQRMGPAAPSDWSP